MDIHYDKDMHDYLIEIATHDVYGEEPVMSIKAFCADNELGSACKIMRTVAAMIKQSIGPSRCVYLFVNKIQPDNLSSIRGYSIAERMEEQEYI